MATSDRTPEPNNFPLEPVGETPSHSEERQVTPTSSKESKGQRQAPATKESLPVTKLGRIWTATVLGIIVLILLIVFIAQNQDQVTLRYFAYEGEVNLGLALFIAAIGGALVVAIAGVARVIQLRATAKKKRKLNNG
ncbi:lipopolysaccharide assembly LapA domain-containing protein [Glutamicibacter sp. JC586]|uniref:LapA family protein n=1 Tax=Glutamicibacter sp. JC586 TaxID=2590552 RepID=UPI00135C4A2C|nr:lipopolysaccharide assembly protein LapA domain-containing protein [Glutamicibacter sp. JC586]